jgi:sarcosine oxidase, subunit beta
MSRANDVAVVGAGIAGAATAYYLARAGMAVTLIDAERPGWGASGRNPGFLWLQTKTAGPQLDLGMAGRRFAEGLTDELGDFGFRASGSLVFFRDERLAGPVAAYVAERCSLGLGLELIDRAAVRRLCPPLSDDIAGAVWSPLDAHQDTRRLVARLVAGAERLGAAVRCGARVAALEVSAGRCTGVVLDGGERVAAGLVVVAAGPGSHRLLAPHGLALPLEPVRYQAAETAPAPFRLDPVLCGPGLFRHLPVLQDHPDFDPAMLYDPLSEAAPGLAFTHQAAQYADGRIQFGCACEHGVEDDRPTVGGQALAHAIIGRDLPGLRPLPVERAWAGIVAQTPDYLPVIDAAPGIDGLALNLGHAFGNLAGAISGTIVAALLAGGPPVVDPAPPTPCSARWCATPPSCSRSSSRRAGN